MREKRQIYSKGIFGALQNGHLLKNVPLLKNATTMSAQTALSKHHQPHSKSL